MAHALAQNFTGVATLVDTVNMAWDAFVSKLIVSTKKAQISRMSEALYRMDDTHLAQIGITRREIPDYANMVIRLHG